jgi:hypothetical protein
MPERLPDDEYVEPRPTPIWPLLLAGAALLLLMGCGGVAVLLVLAWPVSAPQTRVAVSTEPAPRVFVQQPPVETKPAVPPVPKDTKVEPPPVGGGDMLVRLKELPPVTTDNGNKLVRLHRKDMKMTASSVWPGWPAEQVIDEKIESSWFSAANDAAALGKAPWVQGNFPEDVTVRRVTILGNREPAWLIGFTILSGRVTLYDKDERELKTVENDGTGNFRDFDFKFDPPIEGVRGVRFTSLKDQGDQTVFKDIAIAELQVE